LSIAVGVRKLPGVVKIAYWRPPAFDLRQDVEMDEPPVASTSSRADGIVDPPILLYHRVCTDDEWRRSDFAVAASVFREQMSYLASGNYYTPRLSEVLARNGRTPRTPKTPVVLTFDDGYADNLQNALPILQEFGLTAAIFPVLDLGRRSTWWGEMAAVGAPLLTPPDIRSMEAAGIEFGSHSVTHPWLTRLTDSELVEELTRSREVLGSIVEHPLPVLAYPYGDVDPRVKQAVQGAGYSAALAVNSGPLGIHADPWEIRRLPIANLSNDAYMKFKLSGADKVYRWLKWKVRAELPRTRRSAAFRSAPGAP
jgi:peptidoglycan/xylan/chitin deacetylase (PgdA/CDA1 family)